MLWNVLHFRKRSDPIRCSLIRKSRDHLTEKSCYQQSAIEPSKPQSSAHTANSRKIQPSSHALLPLQITQIRSCQHILENLVSSKLRHAYPRIRRSRTRHIPDISTPIPAQSHNLSAQSVDSSKALLLLSRQERMNEPTAISSTPKRGMPKNHKRD